MQTFGDCRTSKLEQKVKPEMEDTSALSSNVPPTLELKGVSYFSSTEQYSKFVRVDRVREVESKTIFEKQKNLPKLDIEMNSSNVETQ